MSADCYFCTALQTGPADPFGACFVCSAFACIGCGNRVPRRARFLCNLCFTKVVLLPSGGLPPGSGGGGGLPEPPDGPDDDGISAVAAPHTVFASSAEFEALMPRLAAETEGQRAVFHADGAIDAVLERARDYGFVEEQRRRIDADIGYVRYDDAAEAAWRADALAGARELARHAEEAQAHRRLKPSLLADAFGVAAASIRLAPGETPSPERLALLPDRRLRFVVGIAIPADAPRMATT